MFKFTIVPKQHLFSYPDSTYTNAVIDQMNNALKAWGPYAGFPKERTIRYDHNKDGLGSITFTLDFLQFSHKAQQTVNQDLIKILQAAGLDHSYMIKSSEFGPGNETHAISINNSYKKGIFYGASYFPEASEDEKFPFDYQPHLESQSNLEKKDSAQELPNLNQLMKVKYKQNTVSDLTLGKALRYACANNFHEDLPLLLSTGVDVNGVDALNQKTPLHFAIARGAVECVAILLAKGARFDICDKKLKTAKDYAEESNDPLIHALFGIQKDLQPKLQL